MKKRRPDSSSETQFRAKSCAGKKKYRTEAEAADMISIQMEYGKAMEGVHPYRCGFCDKWHIGHRMDGD